ncbi:MAG TPA: ATP synthase F1 subunit delta [Pirellulales bacterium]|jgi:F-type H+-transporting ATPase subunit delta|nr:ATP synthase F1 subunit delta [Pirellulales bacterium]
MIDTAKNKSRAINVGSLQVANVYAKALLAAAEKAGQAELLVDELSAVVREALDSAPRLEAVFASALISSEEKAQLLDRLFAGRVSAMLLDFLKVVAKHGRLDILRAIAQQCDKLLDELRGRLRVHVQTATPLADGLVGRLNDSLTRLLGGQPKVDSQVDPALIGGVLMRVGDTVYDGSVARQLHQAREQMITRSVHEIQSRRDRFRHSGGN